MPFKALVADDHPLVREGMVQVLLHIDAEVDIFQAVDFAEVKQCVIEQPDVDLILLDLNMPHMHGIQSIIELRAELPSTAIVIISASENLNDIRGAMNNGVNGYIHKSSSHDVILNALRLVLSGGLYLPLQLTADTSHLQKLKKDILTQRQQDVILLLAVGKANKEIARECSISDKTVKAHLSDIFKRLKVTNRTQAVHQAKKLGLLENA